MLGLQDVIDKLRMDLQGKDDLIHSGWTGFIAAELEDGDPNVFLNFIYFLKLNCFFLL